jgi:hypothetical protein
LLVVAVAALKEALILGEEAAAGEAVLPLNILQV